MHSNIEQQIYSDEEQLITVILYNFKKNMPVVANIVTPDMFLNENYKRIYESLLLEFTKDPDIPLKQALSYHNIDIDWDKITKIINEFYFSINNEEEEEIKQIALKVADHAKARKLVKMVNDSAQELSKGALIDTVKDHVTKIFNEMNREINLISLTSLNENLSKFLQEYEFKEKIIKEDPNASLLAGDSTGFKIIDLWTYGLKKQELWIIAGRPSMGKTALGLRIAFLATQKSQQPCLFISLETSDVNLAKRLVIMESQISNAKISEGNLTTEEKEKMIHYITLLENTPLYFLDTGAITPNVIRNVIIQFNERHSKPIRYIFIDYLQLLKSDDRIRNRQEEVSSISRELKLIAKEFNLTVVALSQLSREVEKRPDNRPKMSDLRESGAIEQDADIILMLYREEYYLSKKEQRAEKPQSLTEIIQVKFKEGGTGTYHLAFEPEFMRFSPYVDDEI